MLCSPGVDAVIGPALDGGFWAIGIQSPFEDLFAGVPMSTPETRARQCARMSHLGLRYRTLESMRDVDEFSDVAEVARLAPGSHFARTAAAVGAIGRTYR